MNSVRCEVSRGHTNIVCAHRTLIAWWRRARAITHVMHSSESDHTCAAFERLRSHMCCIRATAITQLLHSSDSDHTCAAFVLCISDRNASGRDKCVDVTLLLCVDTCQKSAQKHVRSVTKGVIPIEDVLNIVKKDVIPSEDVLNIVKKYVILIE